ncbi:ABC transporter transmembrane domain-containing protein [Leisingera aquimarina]|uniref:ABC transporter transmembrane domain-containing protein n=1 Tax=Leisingera aquimarina TaxID=476529 RepID=UPI001B7F7D57|nr:ABC transporter transmembrane domain-containing protein [Leisingera aquimarina]
MANTLGLVLPLITIQVFDRVIPNSAIETLIVLAVILVGAVLAEAAVRIALAGLHSAFGMRYELETKLRLYENVLYQPAESKQPETAQAGQEALETISKVQQMNSGGQRLSLVDLPFAGVFLAVFWVIEPWLAVAILAILAAVLFLRSQGRKALRDLNENRREISARSTSFVFEVLSGIEHLKGLGAGEFMMRRHERLVARGAEVTQELVFRQTSGRAFAEALSKAAPMLIAMVGAPFVINRTLTPGELAATILLSGRVIAPFVKLQAAFAGNLAIRPALDRLDSALTAPAAVGTLHPADKIETLELVDLDVHSTAGNLVCEGLNLSLQRGESIAISGASGSGKSTLLKTMLGQHRSSSGKVLVNGCEISRYDPDYIASRFAFMQSAPVHSSGSVMDALTGMGGPAILPEALETARELGLADYFALQPDDFLDKSLNTAGADIPVAVQSQLPLVAALVKSPHAILFDEANAQLDLRADRLLLEALKRRRRHAITVLVTQRPSFAAIADRQFHLEDGSLTNFQEFPRAPHQTTAAAIDAPGAA